MTGRESRGRPHARGRGSGKAKTMTWSWESYTPSSAVYDSLWYPRREPASVTPYPPTQCPVPNSQTRILDRRQTEGDFNRNFYIVQVVPDNEAHLLLDESPRKIEVDSSQILEFVSPSELERFENETFRAEAEVLAITERAEEENNLRRRMERNARAGKGVGRVVSGLALGRGISSRGKLRGRVREIGGERGTVMTVQLREDVQGPGDTLESVEGLPCEEEGLQPRATMSPAVHTSPFKFLGHPEVPDIGGSQNNSGDDAHADVTMQSSSNDNLCAHLRLGSSDEGSHYSKRRRTHSAVPTTVPRYDPQYAEFEVAPVMGQPSQIASSAPLSISEDSERSISSLSPSVLSPHLINNSMIIDSGMNHARGLLEHANDLQQDGDDATEEEYAVEATEEEYAVEAIHEHYHDGTQNMYLVKWEGYEDSFDWLPEEDLSGAAELVEEYHKKLRRKAEKGKGRA